MKKIGIIGFGNMGGAIAAGLAKAGNFDIQITEKIPEKAVKAEQSYGLNVVQLDELITSSDIIVLAVKPQGLSLLFKDIASMTKDKKIISIVAGKTINLFKDHLHTEQVARFMPNLAASEGKAFVGVSFGGQADNEFKTDCLAIAQAIGTPLEFPESLMPAVTGLSGSGIAFVFAFIHAMALGGVSCGIAYPDSLMITLKTIGGALAVLEKTKENPVSMLSKVISPAGTTIRGITALEKEGFTYSVIKAVENATARAQEFEG
ncbi:MAG: pyrroline-5-carboxylate reductase [Spirochaetales bacterium]|nr:pyrroline-5-carboxylate reductase [Spirochaetales bacterium]